MHETQWQPINTPFGTARIAATDINSVTFNVPSDAPIVVNRVAVRGTLTYERAESGEWRASWSGSWLYRIDNRKHDTITDSMRRKIWAWANKTIPGWAVANAAARKTARQTLRHMQLLQLLHERRELDNRIAEARAALDAAFDTSDVDGVAA